MNLPQNNGTDVNNKDGEFIRLKKTDVPLHLQSSDLFIALHGDASCDDSDDDIAVPLHCYKVNNTVTCFHDAQRLLSTLRYWGVHVLPRELIAFLYVNGDSSRESMIKLSEEFSEQMPFLVAMLKICDPATLVDEKMSLAASAGCIELIQYIVQENTVVVRDDLLIMCIKSGNLDCLQYCYTIWKSSKYTQDMSSEHTPLDEDEIVSSPTLPYKVLAATIVHGKFECLKLLDRLSGGKSLPQLLVNVSAEYGRKDCMQYLHERDCPWSSSVCEIAAQNGNLHCLRYAHEHGCPWNYHTTIEAARKNALECLKYAYEHGCPWNGRVVQVAANNGNFEVLEYALNHSCLTICAPGRDFPPRTLQCASNGGQVVSAPTSDFNSAIIAASAAGHIDCLALMLERGFPPIDGAIRAAAYSGHFSCLLLLHQYGGVLNASTCTAAAKNGQLDCITKLHELGCVWDTSAMVTSARYGHLICMEYLNSHGCGFISEVCSAAASGGHLACLRFAHENGSPWDANTAANAAYEGHLECLQYSFENDCPIDETFIVVHAASGGHLACMQYLYSCSMPWNMHVCAAAARSGSLRCLQYAHEHGCPWNKATVYAAIDSAQFHCLKYAVENGCPLDFVAARMYALACEGNIYYGDLH